MAIKPKVRKPEPLIYVRVRTADGSGIEAEGKVPSSLVAKGRQVVLQALRTEQRGDVLAEMLAASRRKEKAATLEDLQARIERIEAMLGIGRKPAAGVFDGLGIPPAP